MRKALPATAALAAVAAFSGTASAQDLCLCDPLHPSVCLEP